MEVSVFSVKWQFSLVYLDDIIVFSKTPQRCIELVRKVLFLLHGAGFTLKLSKYLFFNYFIETLKRLICQRHFKLSFHTTNVICKLKPPPKSFTEVQPIFGLYNVF